MENPNRTTANSLHPMSTNSCGTEERPCSQQMYDVSAYGTDLVLV